MTTIVSLRNWPADLRTFDRFVQPNEQIKGITTNLLKNKEKITTNLLKKYDNGKQLDLKETDVKI